MPQKEEELLRMSVQTEERVMNIKSDIFRCALPLDDSPSARKKKILRSWSKLQLSGLCALCLLFDVFVQKDERSVHVNAVFAEAMRSVLSHFDGKNLQEDVCCSIEEQCIRAVSSGSGVSFLLEMCCNRMNSFTSR